MPALADYAPRILTVAIPFQLEEPNLATTSQSFRSGPHRRAPLFAWLLITATCGVLADRPATAADLCKPASPLPQSKCVKDSQCCAGLTCQSGRCQGGCRIGGIFRATGAINPANSCQSCKPSVSTTAWTNLASGASCSDGNACTYNDVCNGSGVCGGTSITCTSDQCNTRTCNGTATCAVTPQTGATCNDGDTCTYGDVCSSSGVCGGTSISCITDQCNIRTCNGTATCTVTPKTGTACDDGDACTYNDVCSGGGVCGGTTITCASDQCHTRSCNGTATCTASTFVDGRTCDDGNATTQVDVCASGTCGGCVPLPPPSGECFDGGQGCTSDADCAADDFCDIVTVVPFVDNGDGTITDRRTCLVWEKKTTAVASGANLADPHDVDNTYTWTADGLAGSAANGTAFTDFLVKLNTAPCFAGHCDWRLPSEEGQNAPFTGAKELESILLASCPGGTSPCIDPIFGPTAANLYCSSTTTGIPSNAWCVHFGNGAVGGINKNFSNDVRAVRGAVPGSS